MVNVLYLKSIVYCDVQHKLSDFVQYLRLQIKKFVLLDHVWISIFPETWRMPHI